MAAAIGPEGLVSILSGLDDFYQNLPYSGSIKLAEKNGLPCAKYGIAAFNKNHFRRSHQGGFDMGGGIALPMAVLVLPGDGLIHRHQNIPLDIGIGILIDRDGCGRMWHEDIAKPVFHTAIPNG